MGYFMSGIKGCFRAARTAGEDILSGRTFTDPYASLQRMFTSLAAPVRKEAETRREYKIAANELHTLAQEIAKPFKFNTRKNRPKDKTLLAQEYIWGHNRLLILSQVGPDQYRYKIEKQHFYTDHSGGGTSQWIAEDPDAYPLMAGRRGPTTDTPPVHYEILKQALQDFVTYEDKKRTLQKKHDRRVKLGLGVVGMGLIAAYAMNSGDNPAEDKKLAPSGLPDHPVTEQQVINQQAPSPSSE